MQQQRRFGLLAASFLLAAFPVPTNAQSEQGRAFATEAMNCVNGAFYGVAVSPEGRVRIDLFADQRSVADELFSRYGNRIDLRLGWFSYPDRNARSASDVGSEPSCPVIPKAGPSNAALQWSTAPKQLRTHSGGDLRVTVNFTNTRAKAVRYSSGDPVVALVSIAGRQHVVGTFPGPFVGVGRFGTLRKNEKATITGVVSTASCDKTIGWVLPPGTYDVRFIFGGVDATASVASKTGQFVSTPVRLIVTTDPAPRRIPSDPTGPTPSAAP